MAKDTKPEGLIGARFRDAHERAFARVEAEAKALLEKHGSPDQAMPDFDHYMETHRDARKRFYREYLDLLAARAAEPGVGHTSLVADSDHGHRAHVRQPNASGGGHGRDADDGHDLFAASARAEMAGDGHSSCAGDGQSSIALPRQPDASESDHWTCAGNGQGPTVAPARDPIADGAAKARLTERSNEYVPPVCDPSAPAENGGTGHPYHVREDQKNVAGAAIPDADNQSRAGEDQAWRASQGQEFVVPPSRDPDSPKLDGDHYVCVGDDQWGTVSAQPPIASGKANIGTPAKATPSLPPARDPSQPNDTRLAAEALRREREGTPLPLIPKPNKPRSFEGVRQARERMHELWHFRINGMPFHKHTGATLKIAEGKLARQFMEDVIDCAAELHEYAVCFQANRSARADPSKDTTQIYRDDDLTRYHANAQEFIKSSGRALAKNALAFMTQQITEVSNARPE